MRYYGRRPRRRSLVTYKRLFIGVLLVLVGYMWYKCETINCDDAHCEVCYHKLQELEVIVNNEQKLEVEHGR